MLKLYRSGIETARRKWPPPHLLFKLRLLLLWLFVAPAVVCSEQLQVVPLSNFVSSTKASSVSLACSSGSWKPILCLWKTPYGHVYTLSEGVFAESGRIRHEHPDTGSGCGIRIVTVQDKDDGMWQCEVGALVNHTFHTNSSRIQLKLKGDDDESDESSDTSASKDKLTSRQEVGNDVILHCSSEKKVHLCRWKTPYLNTYIVGQGIYVERGRIQWLGTDPERDCTIRVARLDLRDAGTWTCEIGFTSAGDEFQVQTKEFAIDIETPLKLSAPTTLMQNANTDATLVCHANKPYDECLWTTPYGITYSFPNKKTSHEQGRIEFFGFASTDCGIIVRNVGSRDNGDWICQLHSNNRNIFQNATDIVPLYAGLTTVTKPRAIPDYDYDKKASSSSSSRISFGDEDEDYSDYSGGSDFSKLLDAEPAQHSPPSRVQLLDTTSSSLSDSKAPLFAPPSPEGVPVIELSRLSTTLPVTVDSRKQGIPSGSPASAVNPLELELLSRISGTRRDSRPVQIVPGNSGSKNNNKDLNTSPAPSPHDQDKARGQEVQRIRDERRKLVEEQEAQKADEENKTEPNEEPSEQLAKLESAAEVERAEAHRRLVLVKTQHEDQRIRKEEIEREREIKEAQDRRKLEEEKERRRKEEELQEKKRLEEEQRKKEEELDRRKQEEEQRKLAEQERERRKKEEEIKKAYEERLRHEAEQEAEKQKKEQEEKEKKEEEEKKKIKDEEERIRKEAEREKRREEERRRWREEESRRRQEIERLRKHEEEKKKEQQEIERIRHEQTRREKDRKEQERREQERKEEERKEHERREQKRKEEERKEEERKEQERKAQERKEQERKEQERKEQERKEQERKEQERKEAERKEQERIEVEERKEQERKEAERKEQERKEAERKEAERKEQERKEAERKEQERKEAERKEAERKEAEQKEAERKEQERKEAENADKEKKEQDGREKEKDEGGSGKEEQHSRHRLESVRRDEERRRRQEAQRKRDEAERIRKIDAERVRKAEEERQQRLAEERQRDLERRRQEDALRKQREDDRQQALERKREEDRAKKLVTPQHTIGSPVTPGPPLDVAVNNISTIAPERKAQHNSSRSSLIPRTEVPRTLIPVSNSPPPVANIFPDKATELVRKQCVVSAFPSNGNVTCGDLQPEGGQVYRLNSSSSCFLTCKPGYVSLEFRESKCFNGRMTQRLECVRPDAMLLVGGRSDTYGVLSSVELVTGKGICRGAVPAMPAMRWRMIAYALDREKVMACAGVNIFGDPKSDCWFLNFKPEPFWSEAPQMKVARDAAAWAQEGNFLFVFGGSIGKFSGYTDSVEMYSMETNAWLEGPKMTSSRYSHCAVGLGNGSIIVTGGYGGFDQVERLDVSVGKWTSLPGLNPVRAQHGCAMVDYHGEQGIIVVGGDSGGTRLRDVRFMSLMRRSADWQKVAELQTARWGRPGVGVVGGRITVAAGWDGVRDLDTVEYYDEPSRQWRRTASKLQTERRWPAFTPISLFLFPKCAQTRE